MPVTARLSRKFYERFGDDVVSELVEWFNSVDATYRADLREFNELNFARFDARLEQRLAQFDAKLEQRLAQFDAKLEQRLGALEAKLTIQLERRLAETKTGILAWNFAFWVTTLLAILGSRLIK